MFDLCKSCNRVFKFKSDNIGLEETVPSSNHQAESSANHAPPSLSQRHRTEHFVLPCGYIILICTCQNLNLWLKLNNLHLYWLFLPSLCFTLPHIAHTPMGGAAIQLTWPTGGTKEGSVFCPRTLQSTAPELQSSTEIITNRKGNTDKMLP